MISEIFSHCRNGGSERGKEKHQENSIEEEKLMEQEEKLIEEETEDSLDNRNKTGRRPDLQIWH